MMNKRNLSLYLCFFFSCLSFGQALKIIDELGDPIKGVFVTNKDYSEQVFTNQQGLVSLDSFAEYDSLKISHQGYIGTVLSINEIKLLDYLLVLAFDSHTIGEVILSTRINDENLKTSAGRKVVLYAKEIERLNSQTTADLLEKRAGIHVQKSQMGGGSPVIRGFEANRILLVVDGVQMNNAIYRSGHLQNIISVDNSSLEQVDIIFGPSNSKYSSEALGGVIHMHTKQPDFTDTPQQKHYFMSRFASANRGISMHYDMRYTGSDYALFTSVSQNDFQDLRMGAIRKHGYDDWGKVYAYSNGEIEQENNEPNIQRNTGYSQTDLMQKVRLKLNPNWILTGNVQYSNSSSIPRFDKLNDYTSLTYDSLSNGTAYGSLKYATWNYGPQKRFFSSMQLDHSLNRKLMDSLQFTLAYQDVFESRHIQKFNTDDRVDQHENVDVYSLNVNIKKNALEYGAAYHLNQVQSKAYRTNNKVSQALSPETRYPNGGAETSTWAIYSTYNKGISKKIKLSTGLRYTATQLEGVFHSERHIFEVPFDKISIDSDALTGNIGLTYSPNPTWKISSIASTGFHAPNVDDTGKLFYKGNILTIPNLDLKPEHTKSIELNVSKNINNRVLINLNAHYTRIEDVIMKRSTNQDFGLSPSDDFLVKRTNVNAGRAEVYGGTTSVAIRFAGHYTFESDYTLLKGENIDQNTPFPHIPPSFGKLALYADFNDWRASLFVLYNGKKAIEEYDIESGIDNEDESPIAWTHTQEGNWIKEYRGTPEWYTLNMSAKYRLSETITLQMALENILDHHYKTFSSGLSAPGRNFIVTVRATL